MTPEIHIEREGAGGLRSWIPLTEWCEVVERTEGVRIAADRQPPVDPGTGRTVNFGDVRGEAEMYIPEDESWRRIFRWDAAGFIAFRATPDFFVPRSRLRWVACELARLLRAVVVDESGVHYD